MQPVLADGVRFEPYWWEAVPRPALPAPELPRRADVAIVGAGFTGLSAALTLARAGRDVVLFDAEDAGWGCSTRNGGQIGTSLRRGLSALAGTYGRQRAVAMYREKVASMDYILELIEREQIECQLHMCGRFIGAHRPSAYETLARELEPLRQDVGIEADMVPRAEQHAELGTDAYFGGKVVHRNASLDPAQFHQGLLDRVLSAGVRVLARTPVTAIAREAARFTVTTTLGSLEAGEVIVATNGYTDAFAPDFRRRVIPIGSYIIATEPLEPSLMDRLMPRRRVLSDTRRVVYYYRPSPDGTRILYGGRVAARETDPAVSGPRLHAMLADLFPELQHVRVTHSWVGFVAYTFDSLPHIGCLDGIHYAMGFCGSGVSMAPHLGHKVALKLLGDAEGQTAFDGLPFQTRPFYTGMPWFLSGAVMFYRMLDRIPVAPGRAA